MSLPVEIGKGMKKVFKFALMLKYGVRAGLEKLAVMLDGELFLTAGSSLA